MFTRRGEYYLRDVVRLGGEGVIERIQNNDPAVTSIKIEERLADWEVAGRRLGESRHLKRLQLNLSIDYPSLFGGDGEPQHLFGSLDDLRIFCNGLVSNESLVSVAFSFEQEGEGTTDADDAFTMASELLVNLLPLFQNNNNIESIELEILLDSIPKFNIANVIKACQSLKSFGIRYSGYDNLDEIIEALSVTSRLESICIEFGVLSRNVCLAIKNMLCREDCKLKVMNLLYTRFSDDEDITIITNGLAENKSIKCFRAQLCREIMSTFLSSVRDVKLDVEMVELLLPEDVDDISVSLSLPVALRQMPMLKSLRLEKVGLDTSTWKSIFHVLLKSSITLHELEISLPGDNYEILQELALCLVENTSLKVLNLSDAGSGRSPANWCNFFRSLHAMGLEELCLRAVITHDSVLKAISKYIVSNQRIRILKIPGHLGVTEEGWRPFATILASHSSLEEIDLTTEHVIRGDILDVRGDILDSNGLDLIVNTLTLSSSLKRVHMPTSEIGQVQALANVIQSPNCQLQELEIQFKFIPTRPLDNFEADLAIRRMNEQATQLFVDSLQGNSSLKRLNLSHPGTILDQYDWSSFSEKLWNTASIDATYQSNHTLESFNNNFVGVPIEVYSMLHLNKSTNKLAVARKKIIQSHSIQNISFAPSVLPTALSCIGKIGSNEALSWMHEILHKVPHMIQTCQKEIE